MMTIPAIGWDARVERFMFRMQTVLHCELDYCSNCGWPYYKHGKYQEDVCVECSGTYNTWDREKRQKAQREYARNYKKVQRDKRRKENRET
jgi:hypothetical protein